MIQQIKGGYGRKRKISAEKGELSKLRGGGNYTTISTRRFVELKVIIHTVLAQLFHKMKKMHMACSCASWSDLVGFFVAFLGCWKDINLYYTNSLKSLSKLWKNCAFFVVHFSEVRASVSELQISTYFFFTFCSFFTYLVTRHLCQFFKMIGVPSTRSSAVTHPENPHTPLFLVGFLSICFANRRKVKIPYLTLEAYGI